MKNTRIISILVIFMGWLSVMAQETCPLPVMVMVDNSDGVLSGRNEKLLDSKLQQIVASKGFGSSAELSHLCLRARISENGDKQIISGNRPVVSGSFDVYLVLTNTLTGENFGAENISLSGSGYNESQMFQSSVARINPSNPEIQRFMQNARTKVFDYYRSHIPSIISQAKVLSQRGNYDEALYLLSTVPPCVEGYDSISQVMLKTFDEYLDVDCHQKLSAARVIWETNQTEEGAKAAAAYIAAIDHRSSCYDEALELLSSISMKIDENLRRIIIREEEDRQLRKDLIRGKAELERKKVENDFVLRQQQIEAVRQVAQAYAQSVLSQMAKQNVEHPHGENSNESENRKKAPVVIINN